MNKLSSLPPDVQANRILNSAQTAEYLGFSLPHFRRLYRINKAPRPIQIGERKYGWRISDVRAWVDARASSQLEAA